LSRNKVLNTIVYSVYSVPKSTDILKVIKARSYNGIDISNKDYRYFIKRTAIFIANRIIKDIKPDIIITPKSTSLILNDLTDELKLILPYITFLTEKFRKVIDMDKIKVDRDNPNITDEIIKRIDGSIRRAKREGYFQIKWIDKRYAKFVSNFFELIDDYNYEKIKDKNVILIDDVYSSGSTMFELLRIMKQYSPAELAAVSIFKTK
jgi:hypothetical protein